MGIRLVYGEGQTPISQDELDELKIKSIAVREELDQHEQHNIEKAQEWLFERSLSPDKVLSEDFVFELHKRMFGDVWSWAGQTRKTNKDLGVDWTEIPVSLRLLLDDAKYWIANRPYPEDEIAVRFKHRIVTIHCFPNGNGRHSRLIADVIIDKIFGKQVFTWGSGNITKPGQTRSNYLAALKAADVGPIDELLRFARS
jgi:Fic-DOC domain mobile mystery protein B